MYKKLLAFLGSNECITEDEYHNSERFLNNENREDFSRFFSIEKDKHYNDYVKLSSDTENRHPSFLS